MGMISNEIEKQWKTIFYPKSNGEPLNGFKQVGHIIRFHFRKSTVVAVWRIQRARQKSGRPDKVFVVIEGKNEKCAVK